MCGWVCMSVYEHVSAFVLTLFCRAEDCSTAVRKPVGKVKPESQKRMGGRAVSAQ